MIDVEAADPSVLRQVLRYNPETGLLTWRKRARDFFATERAQKIWNSRFAGKPAFTTESHGYLSGVVFWRRYPAHRVAWAIYHGHWPRGQIDHINRERGDNRIKNLREVSNQENARNGPLRSTNTSGVVGVYAHRNGRFYAYITVDGRTKSLGGFATLESAAKARRKASRQYGFHDNHGAQV